MLLEQKTTDFLEQLSSSAPIPGGGGASATVGAFASALGLMVTNLTVGKKKYADVEEEILEIREKLEQKKQDLVRMVDEDAEAFEPLAKAYRMPKETEEEQAEKEKSYGVRT
ncbi:MAG: cyclodeaminase/cyclohydrolase family protein [Coprococcus sp.]